MALPASGNLSISDIAGEMWSNSNGGGSLETLSLQANKSANHGIAEFYGFNGVAPFAMSVTHVSSSLGAASAHYYKSVQVTASNVLGRSFTVSLGRFVSVFRPSNGSTAGSVFSDARLSNASFDHVLRAQKVGGAAGFDTQSQNNDLSWDSGTYAIFSFYQQFPTPKPVSIITYASVSIVSVFGQIKSSIVGGSINVFGPY